MPLPAEHMQALRVVCTRLGGQQPLWAVTGSTALAAQGLAVVAHEVDLQTDGPGAYAIERALAEFVVRPVAYSSSGRIRSHFGTAVVESLEVEIMRDVELRRPDGSWRPSPDLEEACRWVTVGDLAIPVLALEHECEAYLLLGRPERAELIRQHLTASGPD